MVISVALAVVIKSFKINEIRKTIERHLARDSKNINIALEWKA